MFNEIQIAQAEYRVRNAKFNHAQEVEGVTVQVPNVLDRALWAVRTALARHTTKATQSSKALTRGAAVAK